jgi:antitoxin component YwqK of YwqJK toxin-antitoxin module
MQLRLTAILVLLIVAGAPQAIAEQGPCPAGSAVVTGPPASELFHPDIPEAGHATWCERYDARGRPTREGLYMDRYSNSAPRSRGRFVDDELEGEVLILHDNGRLWLAADYKAGVLDGRYALFSPSGSPWLTARYRDGQPEGVHTLYYGSGRKSSETRYESGIEQGIARSWHPNGRIRQEIEIRSGLWRGRFASWYPSGAPESQGQYAACPKQGGSQSCDHLAAARHGTWVSHYASGGRRARGSFAYGHKVGTWVHWKEDGSAAGIEIFEAGKLVRSSAGPVASASPAAPH